MPRGPELVESYPSNSTLSESSQVTMDEFFDHLFPQQGCVYQFYFILLIHVPLISHIVPHTKI